MSRHFRWEDICHHRQHQYIEIRQNGKVLHCIRSLNFENGINRASVQNALSIAIELTKFVQRRDDVEIWTNITDGVRVKGTQSSSIYANSGEFIDVYEQDRYAPSRDFEYVVSVPRNLFWTTLKHTMRYQRYVTNIRTDQVTDFYRCYGEWSTDLDNDLRAHVLRQLNLSPISAEQWAAC